MTLLRLSGMPLLTSLFPAAGNGAAGERFAAKATRSASGDRPVYRRPLHPLPWKTDRTFGYLLEREAPHVLNPEGISAIDPYLGKRFRAQVNEGLLHNPALVILRQAT